MIKLIFLAILGLIFLGIWVINLPQFGKNPTGKRLERIKKSPQFKNDVFENFSRTDVMTNGGSIWKVLQLYINKPVTEPSEPLKFEKTDLRSLPDSEDCLIWFGHSSYLLQLGGKKILVDPVFSGFAAPFSFVGKSYEGSNNYSVEDFDSLDVLLITHDHYDHLDYETIKKIHPKVKKFYTSLGVGAHLEHWGVDPTKITELDWWESSELDSSMRFTATPARHFSGRLFTRGKTLWSSFVVQVGNKSYYLGGDSGYDIHFQEIGNKFSPFELALLECGQYNQYWSNIHMMPEETVQAAKDVGAKKLIPVHWGKFTLSVHPWKEPIERVELAAKNSDQPIVIPVNGRLIKL